MTDTIADGSSATVATRPGVDLAWILRRLRQLVATVVGILVLTFGVVHLLPGDPTETILGIYANPTNTEALRKQLHLDRPLTVQFLDYFRDLFTGDLGTSMVQSGRSVVSLVFPALLVTMWVIVSAVVLSVALAIPIGLLAGWTRTRRVDVTIRLGAILILAVPTFVFGVLLLLVVAVGLGAAPAGGWAGNFVGDWGYLWLPALALAAHLTPTLVLVVRQSAAETVRLHFVEAAISRGLSTRRVLFGHVLRNSLLPMITMVGLNLGGLIGGAVVIESVFDLPGAGSLLVTSVGVRDYPVVQGVVMVAALCTVLGNFGADVLYRVVDPRTRGALT